MALSPIPVVDWCARAAKLHEVETAILGGEMITEARFGSDMTRFSAASLSEVKAALDEAMRNCLIERGQAPRRTRFAIRGGFRPY
ncbi:MAG: hypothetical protein DI629_12155 [Mesorhizobium amorphae]|nr:MAG: hypothetical protein DI629_12155 [Mesorhizobium amorphae]